MKTIQIDGKTVEIYDSIESMPIVRFHKFNKYLLVDSGIGADLSDFDNHIERALAFNKTNKPDMVAAELDNLRQNFYFIQNEINPRHLAFCVMVKSINGISCDDLSEDGLAKILKEFENISHEELTAQMDAVKKKIDDELSQYFPNRFDDATIKEYFDQLKKRTLLILDSILNKDLDGKKDEIDKITMQLITYTRPLVFYGTQSAEINYDKQFEDMCLIIKQKTGESAKSMTVLEYYNAFDFVQKQSKAQAKQGRK